MANINTVLQGSAEATYTNHSIAHAAAVECCVACKAVLRSSCLSMAFLASS